MNQWIYVVCYQNLAGDPADFEVLRAYHTEKRAQEMVAILMAAPFERHSLTTGYYSYQRISLM